MAITICDSCELRRICLDKNKFYPVVKCQNYHEGEAIMVEQTNEEWLRQSTTEQLAEFLFEHMDCIGCPASCEKCHRYYDACKEAMLDWLKQPHHEKEIHK